MEDLFIALGVSFMLAFVVAGPKARHALETPPPAKAAKPAKQ